MYWQMVAQVVGNSEHELSAAAGARVFIIDAAQPSAGWRIRQQWKKVSFWLRSVRVVMLGLGSLCCCLVVPAFYPACFNSESQQLEENADWAWCRVEDSWPRAAFQYIRI